MSDFFELLSKNEITTTTNDAVAYKSTGSSLADLNFAVSTFRNKIKNGEDIWSLFKKALKEAPVHTLKWLLYLRDAREGIGEREAFRNLLYNLVINTNVDKKLIELFNIPEYGRYDDLIDLYFRLYKIKQKSSRIEDIKNFILQNIKLQITEDIKNINKPESQISLLAKWLPSENASSGETRYRAKILSKKLKFNPKQYRKKLSVLRKRLDIVEKNMSNRKWSNIKYETVPSKANLIYKEAFLRHDYERRSKYLDDLNNNRVKINSSVAFPHEIIAKYKNNNYYDLKFDATYEAMWRSLNKPENFKETLVVRDGSGSMYTSLCGSKGAIIDVADALSIYCSENNSGYFKNKFITFSNNSEIVDMSDLNLAEKINLLRSYDDYSNTNVKSVFDLILNTALRENLKQEDLPKNVLIISDMEFDSCMTVYGKNTDSLFDEIRKEYEYYGYELPKMIFWNLNQYRSDIIPIQENSNGLILLSGYSTSLMKIVCSTEIEPLKALLNVLNSKRYSNINYLSREDIERYFC